MSLNEDTKRQVLKQRALRRAQFNLAVSLKRIDWTLDELNPESELIKSGKVVLELPENSVFDIQIENEDPTTEKK